MTNAVNEKSPLYLTFTFKDEVGAPLVPTTVEWRLDNVETGTQVVDWTNIGSPASSMAHTIPGTNNTIVNTLNVREERAFGLRLNAGLPAEAHQEFKYHVINLFAP